MPAIREGGVLSATEVLSPRSIAVFGASGDVSKFGGRLVHNLLKHGYPGALYPINPRRSSIQGLSCYSGLAEITRPVDLAIAAVPAERILDVARECAEHKTGCLVVISTGFAETGVAGRRLQDELVAVARAGGMRVIGPNCMGFVNPHSATVATSSVTLTQKDLMVGGVAFVSQSGALMTTLVDWAYRRGIPLGICVSVGNQCDVDLTDFFECLVADDDTKAICLYIEGLRDPARFLEVGRRATAAGKPVYAVKVGRTPEGVAAASAHTASLSGSFEVFTAICDEAGVLLLDDPFEMLLAAQALTTWEPPADDTVAVLCSSGGAAGIHADLLPSQRLRLAPLSAGTVDELREMYHITGAANPIDLGNRRQEGAGDDRAAFTRRTYQLLARDPQVAIVAVPVTAGPGLTEIIQSIAEAEETRRTPTIFSFLTGDLADDARELVGRTGLPACESIHESLRLARNLARAGQLVRTEQPAPAARGELGVARPPVRREDLLRGLPTRGALTEHEAKTLLRRAELPTPEERIAWNIADAAEAAEAVGYPVCLKALSRRVAHKSRVGAVALDIRDAAHLGRAWDAISANLAESGLHSEVDAWSVQEFVSGDVELMVGIRADPDFGYVLVIGGGGVLVESGGDTEIVLPPIRPDKVARVLARRRGMSGTGLGPDVVGAVVEFVTGLAGLWEALAPDLDVIEVNPLLVSRSRAAVSAVDAYAEIRQRSER